MQERTNSIGLPLKIPQIQQKFQLLNLHKNLLQFPRSTTPSLLISSSVDAAFGDAEGSLSDDFVALNAGGKS